MTRLKALNLGHYRLRTRLGSGGMGEVYLAEDPKLGREVAIKVLAERFAGDSDRLARFEREARAIARLTHPNILQVFELSTDQLACIRYLAGERGRGDELFAELRDRARAHYVAPTFLALVHLARGEADDALEHLQEGARINDPWFVYTRLVVRDLLPAEPRVAALVDELGV